MFGCANVVLVYTLKGGLTSISNGGPSLVCERQPCHKQGSLHIDLGVGFTRQDGNSITYVSASCKAK